MQVTHKMNHNDFLRLQIRRSMMNISKEFLVILEELKADNVISEDYYQKLRSKILGSANDKIRDWEEVIKGLDIEIRKN